MRFVLCLLLSSAGLWVGCESGPSDGTRVVEEAELSAEEQAEIDALLDSARTAASDAARDRVWDSAGDASDSVVSVGTAAGGVAQNADDASTRDWPRPEALHFQRYRNDAYGYTFEYPDNLLQWGDAIGGERGQAFETADGTATLLVYATDADDPKVLRQQYEAERARADQEVTYEVLRQDWFVVSGHEGRYVFYQRTFRSGEGLRTFRLRHLARDTEYFGPITERLSHSFGG